MARLRLAVQTPVGRLTALTPFHVAPLVDGHPVQWHQRGVSLFPAELEAILSFHA